MAELKKSNKDALMKLPAMKTLLEQVLENQSALKRLAADEGTTDLEDQMEKA